MEINDKNWETDISIIEKNYNQNLILYDFIFKKFK